jgi:DNA-binding NarL/FixJ family response regulator
MGAASRFAALISAEPPCVLGGTHGPATGAVDRTDPGWQACPIRVVIADDSLLVREGIASLLRRGGFEVAAEAAEPGELHAAVDEHKPDIVIVDVRMPPTHTEEGLEAARAIRGRYPDMAIVILSQHVEVGIAMRVLVESPARLGYLLKDRVTDIEDFTATLRHVAAGGSALDPQIVSQLLSGDRDEGPLATLTPREREVLELIAEGRSNKGIAERLDVSTGVVQKHVGSLFAKLGIPDSDDDHRRILAVLTFLRSLGASRLA